MRNRSGVTSERAVVPGQVVRQRDEAVRYGLTLAPEIDERERQKRSDSTVELVAWRKKLGRQQIGRFLTVAESAHGTGHLNCGSATPRTAQP